MAENTNKPLIRFKGYTDAWGQRKLGEITTKIGSGKTPRGGSSVYLQEGVPLLRSQNIANDMVDLTDVVFISESMDNEMANSRVQIGDVLLNITGASIGRSAVYENTSNANVNQHVCIIRPEKEAAASFIQLNLTSAKGQKQIDDNQAGGGREGINFQQIAKITFAFPSFHEQSAIGSFFRTLDDAITLHQRKLEGLRELKRGYLQQMFPQAGERVPRVRFCGFSGNWVERSLKNLISPIVREVPKPDTSYVRLSVRSHAKGTFHQTVDDPSAVAMDKLYVVRENDLIVNITFAWEHAIAVASANDDGLLVSHRFPTFLIDKSEVNFIKCCVSFEGFRYKLELISPGGAGRNRVLNKQDFLHLKLIVPEKIQEQAAIGNFFRILDNQISDQQTKTDILKQLKSAYLQNMFV